MVRTVSNAYSVFLTLLLSLSVEGDCGQDLYRPKSKCSRSAGINPHTVPVELRGGTSFSKGAKKIMPPSAQMPQTIITRKSLSKLKKFRLYITCSAVVLLWISTGTLFYSRYNEWPLAQSFFYAVDAGMSIGFCTDVYETKVGSRAFTIIFILLGASCVGGALALFVQEMMEGIAEIKHGKYELLLARNAVERADTHQKGVLSYDQFRFLVEEWTGVFLREEAFAKLCMKFDRSNEGTIHLQSFIKKYRGIDSLLGTSGYLYSERWIVRTAAHALEILKVLCSGHNRVFFVFAIWVTIGITWGVRRQGWDIITATHFAISALATGGLTAPPTDSNGILPTEPANFCGMYCLFGIPLFALSLGHFAWLLVESHVTAAEQMAITKPLDPAEFEFAKHLCTTDGVIHFSDFLVMQLLRQGKISIETVSLIKTQFDYLDSDNSGVLPSHQATLNSHVSNAMSSHFGKT